MCLQFAAISLMHHQFCFCYAFAAAAIAVVVLLPLGFCFFSVTMAIRILRMLNFDRLHLIMLTLKGASR